MKAKRALDYSSMASVMFPLREKRMPKKDDRYFREKQTKNYGLLP